MGDDAEVLVSSKEDAADPEVSCQLCLRQRRLLAGDGIDQSVPGHEIPLRDVICYFSTGTLYRH